MRKKKLIIIKSEEKSTMRQKGDWNYAEIADILLGALQTTLSVIARKGIPAEPIVDVIIKELNTNFKEKEQTNE